MRRARSLGLGAMAFALCGGTCGGGSGDGGSPATVVVSGLPGCLTLPSLFPSDLDFVPGQPERAAVVQFNPGLLLPLNLADGTPAIGAPGPFADRRGEIARDACGGLLDPALDAVVALAPDLAVVAASSCEALAFFDPLSGDLMTLEVGLDSTLHRDDFPFLPAPGSSMLAVAASTRICVSVGAGALDSRGDPVGASCNPDAPSYFTSFTSGVAWANQTLFVAQSNLGAGAGGADPQFFPGSVGVFQLDRNSVPSRIEPDPDAPVIPTYGFNPTHATAYTTPAGRELVLITVTGALGLRPDNPATVEREAGGVPLSEAGVDVIDARQRRLVAHIPLGLAAPSFGRIAIDPTGRVALLGSSISRELYAIDLGAVAALPTGAPFQVLDGSDGPSAIIFDAAAPWRLPALPGGPAEAVCPGFITGVDWSADDRAAATDFCDGTLFGLVVDLAGAPPTPVPPDPGRFTVAAVESIGAPLVAGSVGLARAPGGLRFRREPAAAGAELVYWLGIPEGAVCTRDFAPAR